MTAPECTHIKTNGIRCGSPALRSRALCFYHARPARTRFRQPAIFTLPVVNDLETYLYALHLITTALAENKLEISRASTLMQALRLARAHF